MVDIASPVRYYGSKSRALKTLYQYFPEDINKCIFVDLFGGSFIVSLNLHPRKAIINDLNSELVDFWTCVRGFPEIDAPMPDWVEEEQREAFNLWMFKKYPLYEMFKAEIGSAIISNGYMDYLKEEYEREEDPTRKVVLNAAYFYIRNRLSWSGSDNVTVATVPSGQSLREEFKIWHSWFAGKDVRIWKMDFKEVLRRLNKSTKNKVFIYADPPYYEMGWGYKHEMDKENHEQLAKLLKASPHEWVLSYDDHPAIRRLYDGQRIDEVQWFYSSAPGHLTNGKHELIITSDTIRDDEKPKRTSGLER